MGHPAGAETLVAGVDFGSDSVRVLVIDGLTGAVRAHATCSYHRWGEGRFCEPRVNRFRQHPLDHLEALTACFQEVTAEVDGTSIQAISVGATGSTPCPTDASGTPLALLPEFENRPDCMFWLWKDRTATAEAERINEVLGGADPDFTRYQGTYSSEWWWAKILKAVHDDPELKTYASSWVEHSDWIVNLLAGRTNIEHFERNACASGHKTLSNERLGGAIPEPILRRLDPYLVSVQRTLKKPVPAGTAIGTVSAEWAARLGVSEHTRVAAGSLDAHAGAVGAGIAPGRLVKVLGTSTVDMFLTHYDEIEGHNTRELCGIAEDSIVPGWLGGEAGQAAFGDLFAWYRDVITWPLRTVIPLVTDPRDRDALATAANAASTACLRHLDDAATAREPSQIVALDWINGRRYPFPDEDATAALLNLRIGHDAVDIYKALVESAVLGAKAIYDELVAVGIHFREVVLVGGIAAKSPYVCQQIANALNSPLMVSSESEACAKGAAIYASVGAGIHPSVAAAQGHLCEDFRVDFTPQEREVTRLAAKHAEYGRLGRALERNPDGNR